VNYSILLDVSLLPVLICWFQQIIDWIKGFKVVMVNAEMETQTLTVYNYIALLIYLWPMTHCHCLRYCLIFLNTIFLETYSDTV